jgi:LytS/YehU family sensor histidine kinase
MPEMTSTRRGVRGTQITARVVGALLCAAVAYIHIKDQGGIIGQKDPAYMQVGYYMIEVTAVVAAVMLLTRRRLLAAWFLASGVAAGPFVGLVLTRTTGLPGAMDDIGNWTETLGLESLVVEGALFALAATLFLRAVRTQPSGLVSAFPRGDTAGLPSQRHEAATEARIAG